MKKFRWVFILFLVMGGLLMVLGVFGAIRTARFAAHAVETMGTVVRLTESRNNDGGTMYTPVVTFQVPDGREITFTESYSQNPPSHQEGDTVEVLYAPKNPRDATIKGFGSQWFGSTLLCGMGVLFAGIGGGVMLAGRLGEKKKNYLMAYGNAVQTELQGVERNESLEVNGKHPWRITTQWLDPASNKLRVFYSENLWFDPTRFVTQKQLTVLLDPKNPQRYYMDVTFLPELEG